MRTLKFRAYDEEAECFCYTDKDSQGYFFEFYYRDEHTYGELRAFRIIEDSGSIHEPPSVTSKVLDNIQQFTGLKDKNGKEIYEGDIVYVRDMPASPDEHNYNAEIIFKEGCFQIKNDKENICMTADALFFEYPDNGYRPLVVEVIGNIYKDNHLLVDNQE